MKLTSILMVLALALFAGCDDGGSAPSAAAYEKQLDKVVNSPEGRNINKQKELDQFGRMTDQEKVEAYKQISE